MNATEKSRDWFMMSEPSAGAIGSERSAVPSKRFEPESDTEGVGDWVSVGVSDCVREGVCVCV